MAGCREHNNRHKKFKHCLCKLVAPTFFFIFFIVMRQQSVFRQNRLKKAFIRERTWSLGERRMRVYIISHRSSYEVYTLK